MKNVLETLATQKEEVQKEFGTLKVRQEQINEASENLKQELSQVLLRQVELRGHLQRLEQLEKDFQDEPKEK